MPPRRNRRNADAAQNLIDAAVAGGDGEGNNVTPQVSYPYPLFEKERSHRKLLSEI